jgi:His/Glu/Gln/Arg/opine family amino acid ABC transporter permease subunit
MENDTTDRRLHLLALSIFGLGIVAITVVLAGPPAIITYYGWTPYESVVKALQTDTAAVTAIASISAGIAAAVAGVAAFRRMPTRRSRERSIAGAVLGVQALMLGALFLWFRSGNPDRFIFHFLNVEKLEGFGGAFLRGAKNTMVLAAGGELGGIILGLFLAILALSKRRTVRAPARVYINFFRGTPLIWQISALYIALPFAFGIQNVPGPTVALTVFALNTAAYAAEVFRAGIQSVERGQLEAARSLGMTYLQSMRYAIVPQAFRRVIPPLMNEFVILIKDTALIIAVGLKVATELDIYNLAREGYAQTFNATFFTAAAAAYLVVTLPLIWLVNVAERRLRSGLVGVTG